MESYLQYHRLRKSIENAIVDDEQQRDRGEKGSDAAGSDHIKVEFDENDPHNPMQWPTSSRLFFTLLIFNLVLVTGWASAADSPARDVAAKDFHTGSVAEGFATAGYLLGVGTGALLAGPISETVGRNVTYFISFGVYLCWILGAALSRNIASQLIFRTLAGFFAAPSMANFGGSLADMWNVDERALVWPFFAFAPLLGPILAPIASGWLVSCQSWHWVEWTSLILSGASFVAAVLFLPETSAKIILAFKAEMLRKTTGQDRYLSEYDQESGLIVKLRDNLRRIASFMFRELTTVLFGLYLTLLYVLVFSFLEGFKFIFTETYNFNIEYQSSCFGAVAVGVLFGMPFIQLSNRLASIRQQRKNSTGPEARLVATIIAAPLLPISLFWLGWTNQPNISYWSSLAACSLFGFAVYILFTSIYHYLIDAYGTNAASAMSAITFMRYYASAGIVIATEPMYRVLTVRYTMTLVGGVAAIMVPLPLLLYWKGTTIREKSEWAE